MRTWVRSISDEDSSEPSSRVYLSDDGWRAERIYVHGDRGLVHPATWWEISHQDAPSGWGSNPAVKTLAEAKAFPETEAGQAYLRRGRSVSTG